MSAFLCRSEPYSIELISESHVIKLKLNIGKQTNCVIQGRIRFCLLDIDGIPADSSGAALVQTVQLLHIVLIQLEIVQVRVRFDACGV